MIVFEDKEFERCVLEDGGHIAVPFEAIERPDGGLTLVVYSFCGKIAEEFEARFSSRPFSEEAKAFLYEKLTPLMEDMEFDCDGACERIHRIYRATDASALNPACFQGRAERLERLTERDVRTSAVDLSDFSIDPEDERDRIFVVRGERGEIAAFAAVNDYAEDDGFYELTTECAESYRGRGYASECTAELARYLLATGASAEYICAEDNLPSVRLAEKTGFALSGRFMSFVCFRFDETEEDDDRTFGEGLSF